VEDSSRAIVSWACLVYLSGQPTFWGEIFLLVADEAVGKALQQVALSEYTGASYPRVTAIHGHLEICLVIWKWVPCFVPKPGRALRLAEEETISLCVARFHGLFVYARLISQSRGSIPYRVGVEASDQCG